MAENPLLRVARLVGGVALMQGGLGHQVLGQLLISGTSQLAVAGAAVVVGGTARARNPAAQVAIRTAFPSMAVHAVFDKREQMLLHREHELRRRMQARRAPDFALERENGALKRSNETLEKANTDLHAEAAALHKKSAFADDLQQAFEEALKRARSEKSMLKNNNARCLVEKYILQRRNKDLRDELAALQKAAGAKAKRSSTSAGKSKPATKKAKPAPKTLKRKRATPRTKKPER